MITKIQKRFNLPTTGILDGATKQTLKDYFRSLQNSARYRPPTNDIDAELTETYGIPGQSIHLATLVPPFPCFYFGTPLRTISVHKKIKEPVEFALEQVKRKFNQKDIDYYQLNQFGGCYAVRRMRGGVRWSRHAWAIALDWAPNLNTLFESYPNNKPQSLPLEYLEIWAMAGFACYGITINRDAMHVQFTRF